MIYLESFNYLLRQHSLLLRFLTYFLRFGSDKRYEFYDRHGYELERCRSRVLKLTFACFSYKISSIFGACEAFRQVFCRHTNSLSCTYRQDAEQVSLPDTSYQNNHERISTQRALESRRTLATVLFGRSTSSPATEGPASLSDMAFSRRPILASLPLFKLQPCLRPTS